MSNVKAIIRFLNIVVFATFCISCDSVGDAFPTLEASDPTIASPGGIWAGVDPGTGAQTVMIVTEGGSFRFVDQLRNQGFGILRVSNGNQLSSDFQLVTASRVTFPDGTTLADCTLSGMVAERQAMTVTIICTTTVGPLDEINKVLGYDAIYERDSSLEIIAGLYADASGIVTDISADGAIFEQDPLFGCVTEGSVSVINSDFNAYAYRFGFSSCTGQFAIFNGTNFVGLASLDNIAARDELNVAATGEVDGSLVSMIIVAKRL